MPQLRFPKRDTEGLPSVVVDNNRGTFITIDHGSTLSVSYATSKYVYAIIVVPYPPAIIDLRSTPLEVTEDGSTYYRVPTYITNTSMTRAYSNPYWWVNKSIKGWRITNTTGGAWLTGEIIVLTPDNTKPYLPIYYPNTIEIVNDGTTNLDSFANLSYISDGNDNTYASFTFRSGYSTYTLYLKGEISLPMVSLISPFALIEIDPGSSNLASAIDSEKSHGYFHWGAKDRMPSYNTFPLPHNVTLFYVLNSPQKRWSQKVYEIASGPNIFGSFNDTDLLPTEYTHGIIPAWPQNRSALLEALRVSTVVGNKHLYVPYFFSFPHRPIFVASTYHIYYATDNVAEPLVYTAANGSTGKIYIYFGLRIETTSLVTSSFTVKIYGLGFLCFPQMDLEVPLSLPSGAVWFEHIPLGSVTRDNNELTESPDITTDEKFVSIYPVAVDVSSGRAIRYRIRSTSGGTSTFNVDRYYGFHRASDDNILWYYKRDSYSVGNTLQSFDVTGEDQRGQTKVIKVEITPT